MVKSFAAQPNAVAVVLSLTLCPTMFRAAIRHPDFDSSSLVPVIDEVGSVVAMCVIGTVGRTDRVDITEGVDGRVGRTDRVADGRVGRTDRVDGTDGRFGHTDGVDGRVGRTDRVDGTDGRFGHVDGRVGRTDRVADGRVIGNKRLGCLAHGRHDDPALFGPHTRAGLVT